jgi:hypothetical protein
MELGSGRCRCLGVLPLAAAFFGVALIACKGRAFHGANTSQDAGAATDGEGMQRLDASAQATETEDAPPEDTRPNATDASTSPCSAVTGNYGTCDVVLGWGFDGKVCRQWRGCDCASDCARLFSTAHACAQACQMEGGCNGEALVSGGIARFGVGGSCDSLLACVPAGSEGELGLALAGACRTDGTCAGAQTCPLELPGVIDQALWDRYCTASLISGVRIECVQRLL